MNIFRKVSNILNSYLYATEHSRNKFNDIALNKQFANEQVDGYVNSHKSKEKVISDLKTQTCNVIFDHSKIGDNILDFGCGTGRYLKVIENESDKYNLFGIDIAEQVIKKYTRYNIKDAELTSVNILKDTTFVSKYSGFFNVVYSITTLEYISPFDLNKLFMKLHILLSENGTLILQFPVPKNIFEIFMPGYFRHQPISIEKKLKKNGFTILESNGVGTNVKIRRLNKDNSKIREFGYLIVAKKL